MSVIIGVSKGSGAERFKNYGRWLRESGMDIEVIDLWASEDLEADMARLDGLVLTGGSDIDPKRYGRADLVDVCADIDDVRDARELRMLEIAEERELPVLGICRGLQVLNVYRGGTLIAHVPDVVPGGERHQKDGDADRQHPVDVMSGTLLLKAVGETAGEVNTAHHQAIDRLGEGLIVAARAPDGVIEAVEFANKIGSPYMVAVQWHPERMKDQASSFSSGIREQFLFEAQSARILAGVRKPEPKPDPEPPPTPPAEAGPDPMFPILPVIQ